MSFLNLFTSFNLPLRLVITGKCNGKCNFCHREGFEYEEDMSIDTIKECIDVANELQLSKICITGGEPSMRNDLPDILNLLTNAFHGDVILTSNGFNLLNQKDKVIRDIYKLNISMVSFNPNIAKKYQNVNPEIILQIINTFPAKYKNINLMLVDDNYKEINDIIEFCINNKVSIDIMSEFKKSGVSSFEKYGCELKKINFNFSPYIDISHTPKLVIYDDKKCKVSFKHPKLSELTAYSICEKCDKVCYEYGCAIRVYPNKIVSPCLNNFYLFYSNSLKNNITSAYRLIE